MKYALMLALALLVVQTTAEANSAYDNLAFALRQQKVTDDIRHKCDIPASMSDEQLRAHFLNSTYDNSAVLAAVKALREKREQQYQTAISQVRCPD